MHVMAARIQVRLPERDITQIAHHVRQALRGGGDRTQLTAPALAIYAVDPRKCAEWLSQQSDFKQTFTVMTPATIPEKTRRTMLPKCLSGRAIPRFDGVATD